MLSFESLQGRDMSNGEEARVRIVQDPSVTGFSRPENPTPAKIVVKDLNAFFGKTQALKNISLDIPSHRVLAIIGPSGCGKSTFLRCLNRMHEVGGGTMSGSILLEGVNIFQYDPVLVRRRIGMVFQKANPFPPMSIFDNVAAGLRFNGLSNRKKLA